MDHFLYRFSTFSKRMKKIHPLEIWSSCKLCHRIPFFLALRLSVWRFQMPLEGLSFVETLVTFGIIYATDPLLQNMIKTVCLRWLTFDILNYKPLQTVLNYVRQFFKIRVVFHAFYLWNEVGDPHFCPHFWHKLLIIWVQQKFKKAIDWKNFARTSLRTSFERQGLIAFTRGALKRKQLMCEWRRVSNSKKWTNSFTLMKRQS